YPIVHAVNAPAPLDISRSVTSFSGVGPERARLLEKLGVATICDLLLHSPRKYEDRRAFSRIGDIAKVGPVVAEGEIVEVGVKRWRYGTKSQSLVVIDDGTGRLHCRWWNLPHIGRNYRK